MLAIPSPYLACCCANFVRSTVKPWLPRPVGTGLNSLNNQESGYNPKYEPRTKLNNLEKREGNVLFHLQCEILWDLRSEAKQNNSVHAKVSSRNLKEKSFAAEHKRWLIYIHEKLGPELG